MSLKGQARVVVGAGQTPGETIGNGRAAAIIHAREGARLLLADIDAARVDETQSMITEKGFDAEIMTADVKREDDCRAIMTTAVERFRRIDVPHYNVGKSRGDGEVTELRREHWTDIMEMNRNLSSRRRRSIGASTPVINQASDNSSPGIGRTSGAASR